MRLWTCLESVPVDPELGPTDSVAVRAAELEAAGTAVLRWGTVAQPEPGVVEAEFALASGRLPLPDWYGESMTPSPPCDGGARVAMVVPTGVGARIGGFIADAGPFARVVDALSDEVILHPNVVNGGDFYAAGSRSRYVDGYTLDCFFEGRVRLAPPRVRRIGLVIESDSETHIQGLLNAANGIRAIYGIDMVGYAVCEGSLGASVSRSPNGHYLGVVEDARPLLQAVGRLQAAGADAVAIVTTCGGTSPVDWEEHYLEAGVNPVGALEALLSRYVTRVTGLPSAHAPLYVGSLGHYDGVVDSRAAGEVASGTGLPCVLLGLSRAPVTVATGGVAVSDLTGIIVPYGCAVGVPAQGAQRYGVPLLAVQSNTCVVGVPASALDRGRVVVIASPAEAVAYLAASRAGVAWELLSAPPTAIEEVQPGPEADSATSRGRSSLPLAVTGNGSTPVASTR
ncbi:MAG: DUF3326 domain-containing protein [Micromonosporaceae bacterium]